MGKPGGGAARAALMKREASRWQRIYQVVRRIPRGRVATYGQLARLAGLPRRARQVATPCTPCRMAAASPGSASSTRAAS